MLCNNLYDKIDDYIINKVINYISQKKRMRKRRNKLLENLKTFVSKGLILFGTLEHHGFPLKRF